MRLTRSALQAAPPPPKRSMASRTDSNGAEVSISALQPPAPAPTAAMAAEAGGHSVSELIGGTAGRGVARLGNWRSGERSLRGGG
jgi:hypothetical protein